MTIVDTVIVGAGFGGLCMGAKLRQAGLADFVILDKADEVGGTWRENTYPGAECDIPSALYSFSFAPNPTWDFKWAKQAQILGYLKHCCDDFGLRPHLRLGRAVCAADFDEQRERWQIQTRSGESFDCRFFICAVGQLHHPNVPQFKGRDTFSGPAFHSASWRHDVDLTDRSVAVVGNAASAVQLIPEIARIAAHVSVYQRSPNWILPKGDRQYSAAEKTLARVFPGLSRMYRFGIWCLGEYFVYPIIKGRRLYSAFARWRCTTAIKKAIDDPTLRAALIPDYPIGAKRILLSDLYYPALARDNVTLETRAIEEILPTGIATADGTRHEHDVIVYATGFRSNPFLQAMDITGRDGVTLREHWRDGAFAYLGVATAGFPNLFMLYGPNTNTGHTSIVYKHEAQARYIVQLIQQAGEHAIEVDADSENRFNAEIQSRLATLAWSRVAHSWYKDGARITNNWPGSSLEYKRRLRQPAWRDFHIARSS